MIRYAIENRNQLGGNLSTPMKPLVRNLGPHKLRLIIILPENCSYNFNPEKLLDSLAVESQGRRLFCNRAVPNPILSSTFPHASLSYPWSIKTAGGLEAHS